MKYFIALVSTFITTVGTFALDTPQSSDDAEKIVLKMIEAHGGLEKWNTAPSISYTHDMVDPSKPDDHWLSDEIHEQGRRRCYQNWRNDQAILVNDGSEVWTVDWKRLNPPSMMSGVSYFFIKYGLDDSG